MVSLSRRRRRCRPSQSGSKSSALDFFGSETVDFFNIFDSGDNEGKEEEEEEEDEEEMEYLAPNYPQENSRDDSNSYAPWFP